MAIQLAYELGSGVSGNYWKILRVQDNFHNSVADVMFALFKDKAARDAGKDPLMVISLSYGGVNYPLGTTALNPVDCNPYKALYDKIVLEDGTGQTTIDFAEGTPV